MTDSKKNIRMIAESSNISGHLYLKSIYSLSHIKNGRTIGMQDMSRDLIEMLILMHIQSGIYIGAI